MNFFSKILSLFPWLWHHKIITVAIIVILVVGVILWPKPLTPIEVQKVTSTTLTESLSVSGTANAKTSVNLTFPVSGKVVFVGAKEGDNVKKYQTIASLDQRAIQDNLENAVKTAENQQISFDIINDFNGNRALSDTGLSVSARRQLQSAINTLDQTQIAVEIQKIIQEQAFLISPIDGILTRADIQTPGVVANLTTTYTVVDPTSIAFDMEVDQSDIGKVKVGQSVNIIFDAYPDQTLTEKVTKIDFVSHTTSTGGSVYTVETNLPQNQLNKYRVGMNANADIVLAKKVNVLTVPLSSIVNDQYAYIKNGSTFNKAKITLGLESDTDAEITSGLKEGDEVALDPTLAEKRASGK